MLRKIPRNNCTVTQLYTVVCLVQGARKASPTLCAPSHSAFRSACSIASIGYPTCFKRMKIKSTLLVTCDAPGFEITATKLSHFISKHRGTK